MKLTKEEVKVSLPANSMILYIRDLETAETLRTDTVLTKWKDTKLTYKNK